jgi:hypothetical protein
VPPAEPKRGLRRIATRIPGGRSRRRLLPEAGVPGADDGHVPPVARPEPVLWWRDPSHPPPGDFAAGAIANGALTVANIPRRGDTWEVVSIFALSYDGYAYWDDVAALATAWARRWMRDRSVPASIDEVRGCLFYEQRRWQHFGEDPSDRRVQYVWVLLDTLRALVTTRSLPAAAGHAPVTARRVGDPPEAKPPAVCSFLDDDGGYLAWAAAHHRGFVVNADRTLSPGSLVLHRATCSSIGGTPSPGRRRTATHRKICAADVGVLVAWCRRDIGADPGVCRHCRPLS